MISTVLHTPLALLTLAVAMTVLSGCAMRDAETLPAPIAAEPESEPQPELQPEGSEAVAVAEVVAEPEASPDTITEPAVAPAAPVYNREDVLWIQQRLKELGYYDSKVDGTVGQGTRNAVRAYQQDQDIRADGRPTRELRDFMWRNGG